MIVMQAATDGIVVYVIHSKSWLTFWLISLVSTHLYVAPCLPYSMPTSPAFLAMRAGTLPSCPTR